MADLRLLVDVDGTGEVKALNTELERTPKHAKRAGKALDQFGEESLRATRKTKRFAAVGLQQLGYQVGDFAVQVQGGTNAFVAFGQQGSQLLGILGPLGAVAGALLAIFTAFAAAMSETEDSTGAAAAEFAKLRGEFEPLLTVTKNLLVTLREMAYDTLNVLANNLQLVISYASAAALIWGGQAGLTGAITLATLAVQNFGKVVRTVLVGTVVGIAIVALGQLINMMLQLREATGSWGKAFGLVGDVISAFFSEFGSHLANFAVVVEQAGIRAVAGFLDAWANLNDRLKNWLADVQARFDQLAQWMGNLWREISYTIVKAIDDAMDKALIAMQKVFDIASNLPGVGTAFAGLGASAGAATSLYTPKLPVKEVETYESFFGKRLEEMAGNRDMLRGAAAGLRKYADEMQKLKTETPQTAAALDALQTALESVGITTDRFEIRNLFKGLGESAAEEIGKATEEVDKLQEKTDNLRERIAGDFARTIIGSFRAVADGTKTVGQAFQEMTVQIIRQIMDVLIWQPLIKQLTAAFTPMMGQGLFGAATSFLASANGNAFNNGNVVPFAYGGVVNSPTLFGMSGGRTGLMGEAGPEAILPLKRGAGGKLGVEGGGNVTVHQSFNFAANGDESVKKIIAEAAPGIAKMTEAQIVNSRQRGGQMRRVFS